jgi:hypothetical protein
VSVVRRFPAFLLALIVAAACSIVGFAMVAIAATGSGANGGLVVVHDRQIAAIRADGGIEVLATGGLNFDPEWSPDGSQMAYVSGNPTGPGFHIFLANADGSGRVDITAAHATDAQWQPSWSPDGTKIAFDAGSPDTCRDVWIMNVDGSDPANITNWPHSSCFEPDSQPEWSPDGTRIAFVWVETGTEAIWSMRTDGSDARFVTEGVNPSFSPDGSRIAFAYARNIWVANADGSQRRQLTDGNDMWWASSPDWSPDGTRIAFTLWPRGGIPQDNEIYTIGVDGTGLERITSNTVSDTQPDWRPMPVAQPPGERVGLVDPATGEWHLRNEIGTVTTFYYGNPGDVPFMGDWDCDGIDTPGLFRTLDAYAYLRNSNTQGNADIRFFFGNPSDVPLAGDFNGDGCDTLSIYRPSEARFYIMNKLGENEGGLGAADYSFLFGNVGDKPVVGDWDGDGIDEIGLHRESTGFFYYRNTLTTGVADGQFFFGDPGDRFVAGDWGVVDGIDTPGMFRPSNSTFYFRHTLTQGNADSEFTWTGAGMNSLPVSGDFTLD